MPYTTYILECADQTLYTGCTNNLDKRIITHNTKKNAARYTKARRPVVLKYFETFDTLNAARKREVAIKKLTRQQKIQLIHSHSYEQAKSI